MNLTTGGSDGPLFLLREDADSMNRLLIVSVLAAVTGAVVADLHDGGTTIFLTTHYIEEAERLCQRIAFLVAGRIARPRGVYTIVPGSALPVPTGGWERSRRFT